MVNVIGVRFKKHGKVYYFHPLEAQYNEGDGVIVETARGVELGYVGMSNRRIDESKLNAPLKSVLRAATEEDFANEAANAKREAEAFKTCEQAIATHKLDMKLIDVEFTFDGSKILFYFTAEGRVDFRELVKNLAGIFRTRIELRQIGVRDEAKMLGGLGICGQPFCCSRFLNEFHPVSIKMAKEQGLSLNPTKISGTCGRLMCCLKYEQEAYEDLLAVSPKQGATVNTPDGVGMVSYVSLLRGMVDVRLDGSTDSAPSRYAVSDIEQQKRPAKAPAAEGKPDGGAENKRVPRGDKRGERRDGARGREPRQQQAAQATPRPQQAAQATPKPQQAAQATPKPQQAAQATPKPQQAAQSSAPVMSDAERFRALKSAAVNAPPAPKRSVPKAAPAPTPTPAPKKSDRSDKAAFEMLQALKNKN